MNTNGIPSKTQSTDQETKNTIDNEKDCHLNNEWTFVDNLITYDDLLEVQHRAIQIMRV
jgi:hypothetical protein